MADEYIPREAALKAIEDTDTMCDLTPDAYDRARRYIERIPAADVVPNWIPVEERRPGENEFVLCFSAERYMVVASTQVFDTFKITHWMPLPNPPARAIDK